MADIGTIEIKTLRHVKKKGWVIVTTKRCKCKRTLKRYTLLEVHCPRVFDLDGKCVANQGLGNYKYQALPLTFRSE